MGRSFLHFIRVLLGLDAPQTQTTEAERTVLARWASGRRRLVEIGVFEGFTTRLMAQSMDRDARLYGVDPFFPGRIGICWGEHIARHVLRPYLREGRVVLLKMKSEEVGAGVVQGVDFVFIDADHSWEGIESDWNQWTERLEGGGVIALHDAVFDDTVEGLRRYGSHRFFERVVRSDPRFELVETVDSLAVLKKLDAQEETGSPVR